MSMKTVKCQHCGKALIPKDVFVHVQYQCPKRQTGRKRL
jgi:phage FluMu protein Com